MVQGTGSGVGKSVLVSALCRIFLQDGFNVAPFKAQNMALNSFVTADGGEIGRAQATQALACGKKPTVHMNPVLIKPSSDRRAQIILRGRPVKNMSVYEYKRFKKTVFGKVKESLDKLSGENDIVVIEGAGSPAEVNLKSHDMVNMKIAALASAPVILVGDIDKGGVFAWLIGTLELLDPGERRMVKGFIINKFRGDKRLLMPGLRFLEDRTGIKVLGVIPYYHDIKLPEEDSLPVESREGAFDARKIKIAVAALPHMSNFDDFDALEQEEDVSLVYTRDCRGLNGADVIILPGTKNTIGDMAWLKKSGLARKLSTVNRQRSAVIVGICGGYQMLGRAIRDTGGVESGNKETEGLGMLPISTAMGEEKVLSQVKGRFLSSGMEITGYEIHHGRTKIGRGASAAVKITEFRNRPSARLDGAGSADGRCWGTYVHGIFDNDAFRRDFLNGIRRRKGWAAAGGRRKHDPDGQIDKLSALVRDNIDMGYLRKIVLKGA